ncbi:MAG: type 2 isopentenyl-diphosphate Delta-isomerase [Solirubrobacterales bacterium]|nr:type 2 isopentenyl-diphosphate Delta-isomerase [Solirubrobacterales bacterium]
MPRTTTAPSPAADAGRKADHLRIASGAGIAHRSGTGLDAIRLRHRALPERNLAEIGLTTRLLGAQLAAPVFVSAMTGGTAESATINRRLARAAADHGIALVLGSGRRLLDDPALLRTYRPEAGERPPLLLANLGAAQIRAEDGPERAERLVELLDADGLSIHLNALQEAVQPEGEPEFEGVLDGIAAAVARLAPRPVVVKEVGFGMDPADVALLRAAGVAGIDVAGSGGTNWALIEGRRDPRGGELAAAFADWGVPTADALIDASRAAGPELPIIASGGLQDGVDIARCLALGARAAGLARPFLVAAQADRAGEAVATVISQLRIATWAAGASDSSELGPEHLRSPVREPAS